MDNISIFTKDLFIAVVISTVVFGFTAITSYHLAASIHMQGTEVITKFIK